MLYSYGFTAMEFATKLDKMEEGQFHQKVGKSWNQHTITQLHKTQNPTAEQKKLNAVTRKYSERGKSDKFQTS